MKNTLPESAAITTKNLIGMIVYTAIFLIILWFTPPHKLKRWLYPSALIVSAAFVGIIAWAVHTNGGSPGDLVSGTLAISSSQRAFRIIQCISSISGSYGGAADRISDWTRFEKKRGASTPAMLLAMPFSITLVALIGVVLATCTDQIYAKVIWNPLVLLSQIQTDTYTPKSRAGTFFAGVGLLCSQVFIQMSQNTIPYGMDVAGLFPRYVSMRRGAVFLTLFVMLINPWRFLSQASIFVTILSSFTGLFSSISL
jgi:NCS1 family nucleobase:cation symporter-1